VRFESNDTNPQTGEQVPTGNRIDVLPSLSLPLEWPAGFVKPKLSYRYTVYDLDNAPTEDSQPSRTAPIFSVDSGLFFERPLQSTSIGNNIVTLEPRMFYLYVPFENQQDIPLFDSTEIDRSFSWLFLENRFTGADRLGDANQLTTALTSRLLSAADGRERFRASVGQVHYFRDREVTLTNADPEEESNSDLFAEAGVKLNFGLSVDGTIQWDPDENQTRRSAFDIRYHPATDRLVNFSHRFARDELEQLDFSFLWKLQSNLRAVGRWNYSLPENNILDALAGMEYGDCCWALRMVARHHRDNPEQETADNSVYLEFELKGLASVGNRVNELLEEVILGYQPTRY
jgi:LPS-assembly protein